MGEIEHLRAARTASRRGRRAQMCERQGREEEPARKGGPVWRGAIGDGRAVGPERLCTRSLGVSAAGGGCDGNGE